MCNPKCKESKEIILVLKENDREMTRENIMVNIFFYKHKVNSVIV